MKLHELQHVTKGWCTLKSDSMFDVFPSFATTGFLQVRQITVSGIFPSKPKYVQRTDLVSLVIDTRLSSFCALLSLPGTSLHYYFLTLSLPAEELYDIIYLRMSFQALLQLDIYFVTSRQAWLDPNISSDQP